MIFKWCVSSSFLLFRCVLFLKFCFSLHCTDGCLFACDWPVLLPIPFCYFIILYIFDQIKICRRTNIIKTYDFNQQPRKNKKIKIKIIECSRSQMKQQQQRKKRETIQRDTRICRLLCYLINNLLRYGMHKWWKFINKKQTGKQANKQTENEIRCRSKKEAKKKK